MTSVRSAAAYSSARPMLVHTESIMDMASSAARDMALHRIEFVFRRVKGSIRATDRFDVELKARPPSDFRLNEFDELLEDAQQMQRSAVKLDQPIVTVEDYCVLAERFSCAYPDAWASLVRQWRKEEDMNTAPSWRQIIWKLVGL